MKASRISLVLLFFVFFSSVLLICYTSYISYEHESDRVKNVLSHKGSNILHLISGSDDNRLTLASSYNLTVVDLPAFLIIYGDHGTHVIKNLSQAESEKILQANEAGHWAAGSFNEYEDFIFYKNSFSDKKMSILYGVKKFDIFRSTLYLSRHLSLAIAVLAFFNLLIVYYFLKTKVENPLNTLLEDRLAVIMQSLFVPAKIDPVFDFKIQIGFISKKLKQSLERTLFILYFWAKGKRLLEEFSNIALSELDKVNIFKLLHNMVHGELNIKHTVVMELNNSTNRLEMLYSSDNSDYFSDVLDTPKLCYAFRSSNNLSQVSSSTICDYCKPGVDEMITCMPIIAGSGIVGVCRFIFDQNYKQSPIPPSIQPEHISVLNEKFLSNFVKLAGTAMNGINLLNAYKNQAITDALTGLYNRRYIVEYLTNIIYISKRGGDPLSVMMIDIDHFKRFNDEYGHKTGDAVLREVGHWIRRSIRDGDIVGRYGGEEFVCILPNSDLGLATQVAERIRQSIKEIDYQAVGLMNIPRITISIGIAQFPIHGYSHYHLTHAADKALYRAKTEGRDRVVTHGHLPEKRIILKNGWRFTYFRSGNISDYFILMLLLRNELS